MLPSDGLLVFPTVHNTTHYKVNYYESDVDVQTAHTQHIERPDNIERHIQDS